MAGADLFIQMIDAEGEDVCSTSYGDGEPSGSNIIHAIEWIADKEVVIAGEFEENLAWDPETITNSAGRSDAFVARVACSSN